MRAIDEGCRGSVLRTVPAGVNAPVGIANAGHAAGANLLGQAALPVLEGFRGGDCEGGELGAGVRGIASCAGFRPAKGQAGRVDAKACDHGRAGLGTNDLRVLTGVGKSAKGDDQHEQCQCHGKE